MTNDSDHWKETSVYMGVADIDGVSILVSYDEEESVKLLQKARSRSGDMSIFFKTTLKKSEHAVLEALLKRKKNDAALKAIKTFGFEVPEDMMSFAKLIPREKFEEFKNGNNKS